MNFICRPARLVDAASCAPLIFASGEAEFGYMFGVAPEKCIAFLLCAFLSPYGRFSYRRHRVAIIESGEICSVMAIHEGGRLMADDAIFALQTLRYFGIRSAVGILMRGARLATELPAPARGQCLIAHCATRSEFRGRGALTALMTDALEGTHYQCVLDVRLDNGRARKLYGRLGFTAMEHERVRHPRLPSALASERMSKCG